MEPNLDTQYDVTYPKFSMSFKSHDCSSETDFRNSSAHTLLPFHNTTPSATDLEDFQLFPKFPAEIRVAVWKLAEEPRVVEVRFDEDGRKNTHEYVAKQPALLYVNRESRCEALKRYKLKFEDSTARNVNSVYFDDAIDSLYISRHGNDRQIKYFVRWHGKDLEKLERLYLSDLTLQEIVFPTLFKPANSSKPMAFQDLRELCVMATGFEIHRNSSKGCTRYEACFDGAETVAKADGDVYCEKIRKTEDLIKRFKEQVQKEEVRLERKWREPNIRTAVLCEVGMEGFGMWTGGSSWHRKSLGSD